MSFGSRVRDAWRALIASPAAPAGTNDAQGDADSVTFADIIASEQRAAKAANQPRPPEDRHEKIRVSARPGTLVLIIDDSPTVVALLGRMLRQDGYRTLEALSAEVGLEMAQRERPDLVFLDIVLPQMDGFAALRRLRHDPQTKEVPVIMISGNIQATEQFYIQRIGADDFMKKPFTREELFARIEPLLDDQRMPRRLAKQPLTPMTIEAG